MIKINRLTDYAIVVMAAMARDPNKVVKTGELAAESGVPGPTVSKLLKNLAKSGLLISQRGATGGFKLSRHADRISVAEIVTALEGPIALTACVEGSEDECNVAQICAMRGNWNHVNRAIETALQSVTLRDMSQGIPDFITSPPAKPQDPKHLTEQTGRGLG